MKRILTPLISLLFISWIVQAQNTFTGTGAGNGQNSGGNNSAHGAYAGDVLFGSDLSSFYGYSSGKANTTGSRNSFLGAESGRFNTTGGNNTFLGYAAGYNNVTGNFNTTIGSYSLRYNTEGFENTASGYQALEFNTNGSRNVAIGYESMRNTTTGSSNVASGQHSLYNNNTGNYNTAFGRDALFNNITGSFNTSLGYNAGTGLTALSNTTAIGANAKVDVDYGIVIGTVLNFVGIRQNSPTYALHVLNAYTDGNTWFNASDKNLKENFVRIKEEESVLAKVLELPIQYWNYKDSKGSRHIGPTAQDFYKVFGLGDNEKAIASVDEGGVALAAIQELARKTQQLEQLIKSQQQLILTLVNNSLQNSYEKTENEVEVFQNSPNPFIIDTEIRINIPQSVRQAVLYIYDLQGKPMKSYEVGERGVTTVKIDRGTLTAGMYIYTVVADGVGTPVKKMILSE